MLLKFLLTSWLLIPVGLAVGSYSSLLFPLLDIRFNLINFSILFMTVGLFIYWLIYHEILTTVKDLSVWKLVMIWIVFLFQAGVFFYAFGDSLSPHHNHDASDHVYVIQKIIDSGSNDPRETLFTYQSSWYPLGFHSVASFLCLLSGNSNCVMLPWYLVFVVTGFSTIAIFLFTFVYFGKFRLAILASIVSILFFVFPYAPYGWGGWSQICGQVLIFFNLYLCRSFLQKRKKDIRDILLLGIFITTIFYVHPTDFLTFVILAILTNFDLVFREKFWKSSFIRGCLAVVAFSTVNCIPGYLGGKTVLHLDYHRYSVANFSFKNAINWLTDYYVTGNNAWFLLVLCVLGLFGFVIHFRKNYPQMFLLYVIIFLWSCLCVLLQFCDSLYRIVYPIYPWGTPERLFYSLALFYSISVAFGFDYIIFRVKKTVDLIFIIIVFVIIGWRYLYKNINILKGQNILYSSVTLNDLEMFDFIDENKRDGKILTNLKDDSGAWINKFIDAGVYFPTSFTADLKNDDLKMLNLFDYDDKAILSLLKEHNIKYVFKGEKLIKGGIDYFPLAKLMSKNYFKLIKKFGESYLFEVDESNRYDVTDPLVVDIGSSYDLMYIKADNFGPIEETDGGRRNVRWLTDVGKFVFPNNYSKRVKVSFTATSFFANLCSVYANDNLLGDFRIETPGLYKDYSVSGSIDNKDPINLIVRCYTDSPVNLIESNDTRRLSILLDKVVIDYD